MPLFPVQFNFLTNFQQMNKRLFCNWKQTRYGVRAYKSHLIIKLPIAWMKLNYHRYYVCPPSHMHLACIFFFFVVLICLLFLSVYRDHIIQFGSIDKNFHIFISLGRCRWLFDILLYLYVRCHICTGSNVYNNFYLCSLLVPSNRPLAMPI